MCVCVCDVWRVWQRQAYGSAAVDAEFDVVVFGRSHLYVCSICRYNTQVKRNVCGYGFGVPVWQGIRDCIPAGFDLSNADPSVCFAFLTT